MRLRDNCSMGQLSMFSRAELSAMRDRTARRNYSAAAEEFRREHQRRRSWGLMRRQEEKLGLPRGSLRPALTARSSSPTALCRPEFPSSPTPPPPSAYPSSSTPPAPSAYLSSGTPPVPPDHRSSSPSGLSPSPADPPSRLTPAAAHADTLRPSTAAPSSADLLSSVSAVPSTTPPQTTRVTARPGPCPSVASSSRTSPLRPRPTRLHRSASTGPFIYFGQTTRQSTKVPPPDPLPPIHLSSSDAAPLINLPNLSPETAPTRPDCRAGHSPPANPAPPPPKPAPIRLRGSVDRPVDPVPHRLGSTRCR